MKLKVSKKELRECVESAMLRLVNESKPLKFRDNDECSKKPPKHANLKKGKGCGGKEKGGANNRRWQGDWDED